MYDGHQQSQVDHGFSIWCPKQTLVAVPLDEGHISTSERVECLSAFHCSECLASFATHKALLTHKRSKHKGRSECSKVLDDSGICPVCRLRFSSRTRLLAHVNDLRKRGAKKYVCGDLLRANLVAPVAQDTFHICLERDRLSRMQARKRGRTQPLSLAPPKRRRSVSIVPPMRCIVEQSTKYLEPLVAPANALKWESGLKRHLMSSVCRRWSRECFCCLLSCTADC